MSLYVMISLVLMIVNSAAYFFGRERVEAQFYPVYVTPTEMALTIFVGSSVPVFRWFFTIGMCVVAKGIK